MHHGFNFRNGRQNSSRSRVTGEWRLFVAAVRFHPSLNTSVLINFFEDTNPTPFTNLCDLKITTRKIITTKKNIEKSLEQDTVAQLRQAYGRTAAEADFEHVVEKQVNAIIRRGRTTAEWSCAETGAEGAQQRRELYNLLMYSAWFVGIYSAIVEDCWVPFGPPGSVAILLQACVKENSSGSQCAQ